MEYTLPKALVLDYDQWICGMPQGNNIKGNHLGEGKTQLLNDKDKMCCLGQFCEQAGVPRKDLLSTAVPEDVGMRNDADSTVVIGLSEIKALKTPLATALANDAMQINDKELTTVLEKAEKLKELFATAGYTVTLKNFPEGTQ